MGSEAAKLNAEALEILSQGNFIGAKRKFQINAKKHPGHQTFNNLGQYYFTEGLEMKNGKVRNADTLGIYQLKKAEKLQQTPLNLTNLGVAYYERASLKIPANMRIIHQKGYKENILQSDTDRVYFRLFHSLNEIIPVELAGIRMETVGVDEVTEVVSISNACYKDLQVTLEQMIEYTQTPVYHPDLWIFAVDAASGQRAGCGIADFDSETGELILEWIQVLPDYCKKGIGTMIVNELLCRKPAGARFATVSGRAGDRSNPEGLYRKCGFPGQDYWHVLTCK